MNKRQESHLCFMLKYEINVKKYIHLFSEINETALQKIGNKRFQLRYYYKDVT